MWEHVGILAARCRGRARGFFILITRTGAAELLKNGKHMSDGERQTAASCSPLPAA